MAFEKQALTIIFLEVMTDATPPIVSTIVEDIEKIVRVTRFDGWQKTVAGEGEIKRVLRDLFLSTSFIKNKRCLIRLLDKAYNYIHEHY